MNDNMNGGNAVLQGDFYMVMEGSVHAPNAVRPTAGFFPSADFGSVHKKATAANPPKVVHQSYGTADEEAQRLAKENPGKTFFVLKAHSKYVAKHIEKTVL